MTERTPTRCPRCPELKGKIYATDPRCKIGTIGQNFNGVVYRCSKHGTTFTLNVLKRAGKAAKK